MSSDSVERESLATSGKPGFHHIGVQTADLENSLAWYTDFFRGQVNWSLDHFSELTLSRLPGIVRLVEVTAAGLRFHLFERAGQDTPLPLRRARQFQHVCLDTDSLAEIQAWRARWIDLHDSGKYEFAFPDQPSYIDTDSSGVSSFYCLDPDGLEFEFTHLPDDVS